jgi:hypothetical protein
MAQQFFDGGPQVAVAGTFAVEKRGTRTGFQIGGPVE